MDSRRSGWFGEELQESLECVIIDNGWVEDLDQYNRLHMSWNNPRFNEGRDEIEKDNSF